MTTIFCGGVHTFLPLFLLIWSFLSLEILQVLLFLEMFVFSWLQLLLIFPLIHHFYHCLVNTVNSIDLCFPTALVSKLLILCQAKHSYSLSASGDLSLGNSNTRIRVLPTMGSFLQALSTAHPSLCWSPVSWSPAVHRNYFKFSFLFSNFPLIHSYQKT